MLKVQLVENLLIQHRDLDLTQEGEIQFVEESQSRPDLTGGDLPSGLRGVPRARVTRLRVNRLKQSGICRLRD